MTGANYMDRFLGWLESTTPEERLGRPAAEPDETLMSHPRPVPTRPDMGVRPDSVTTGRDIDFP